MFNRRRNVPATPDPSAQQLAAISAKFVQFCSSYERSDADILVDFEMLCALREDVTHIAFSQTGELLVATSDINIFSSESRRTHHIGQFLITIIRKRDVDRTLTCGWYMQNVTRVINHPGNGTKMIHPHAFATHIPEQNEFQGKLCFGDNFQRQQEMLQAGRIYDFIELLLAALKTYTADGWPVGNVIFWPMVEEYA